MGRDPKVHHTSVVAVAAIALLAAACGSTSTSTTNTTAPTTAAPAPATTAGPAPTTTAASAPTTTAATTTTVTPPTTVLVPPAPANLTHGGEAVGVYLKVIEESESSGNFFEDFADVTAAVEAMGYFAGFGDLGCDGGAQEGLSLPEGDYLGSAVYFSTVEDAETFATIYGEEIVGIATVRTGCLD